MKLQKFEVYSTVCLTCTPCEKTMSVKRLVVGTVLIYWKKFVSTYLMKEIGGIPGSVPCLNPMVKNHDY